MPDGQFVYVVDDEEAVRDSVALLLEAHGLSPHCFASGAEFLAIADSLTPGCVLTDMRMPGMDGLDLLRHIGRIKRPMPVVMMTAHGEVPLAVQALKLGAADFIEKPFPAEVLLTAVTTALQMIDQTRQEDANLAEITHRLGSLTPREREVMEQLVDGNQNKVIAYNLGMSPRTVEVHRARIMEKMQARSLSALIRMAMAGGSYPAGSRR